MKKCIKCGIEKEAIEKNFQFRKDTNKLNNTCRECINLVRKKNPKENKVIQRQNKTKELLKFGLIECSICKLELDKNMFSLQSNNPTTGRASACKECTEKTRDRKSSRMKERCKKYNIDIFVFEDMYYNQNGKCKICDKYVSKTDIHIDHCHSTNKVRGLLCRQCNTAIGSFYDDINILKQAIKYLSYSQ